MGVRVPVINSLNEIVEESILTYEERSGKGGYHRVYYARADWAIEEQAASDSRRTRVRDLSFFSEHGYSEA